MALGFPFTKTEIDMRTGQVVLELRNALDAAQRIKVVLDEKTDGDLTGLGYTAPEVTLLRAAFTDLDNLARTARGQRAQSPASDFFFNARKLLGLA
jgi:hypothetical protein